MRQESLGAEVKVCGGGSIKDSKVEVFKEKAEGAATRGDHRILSKGVATIKITNHKERGREVGEKGTEGIKIKRLGRRKVKGNETPNGGDRYEGPYREV